MKNSDMKIIAIILSIALFFTIITSNAVSVASVILLAKDTGTASTDDPAGDQGGTQAPQGGTQAQAPQGGTQAQAPQGSTSTTPSGSTSTSTTPSGSTSTTPSGSTGGSTSTDANKPADNAGTDKPADNAGSNAPANGIDKEALAMYQKAAKDIHDNGVAGYHKTNKQEIIEIDVGGNDAIKDLIASFLKPGESDNAKGTDDAKNRMPISDCSESYIQSASKVEQNGNYIVTIVLKDQINPSYNDTDGLVKMSRDFLDMKDVHETVKTNSAVKLLVKELTKGEMNYKAFTITAEMTKDGKFVNIKHFCDADLVADAKLIVGSLSGTGVLRFTAEFSNFTY